MMFTVSTFAKVVISAVDQQKSNYHHGNLPDTLLEYAIAVLNEAGVEGLSLREVARRAGVSHSAAYRHYADKKSMLAAVAVWGFSELHDRIRSQIGPFSGAPRTRLFAAVRAYVAFGQTYPHLLRVMFGDLPHSEFPELQAAARRTFDLLLDILAEGQQQGMIVEGDLRRITLAVWAAFHGLTEILNAEKIPYQQPAARYHEQLVRSTLELLMRGISLRMETE